MFNAVYHTWLDLPTDPILVISLCCSICAVVPLHFVNCVGPSELFLLGLMNGKGSLCVCVLAQQYFAPDLVILELMYTVRCLGSPYFFFPSQLFCVVFFTVDFCLLSCPFSNWEFFNLPQSPSRSQLTFLPSVAFTVPFPFSLIYQTTEDLVYWILRY